MSCGALSLALLVGVVNAACTVVRPPSAAVAPAGTQAGPEQLWSRRAGRRWTGPFVVRGDTLFGAGCGRIFEGDPEMMFASLRKLAALPPETLVYPGHEYTRKNLEFALTVEPHNEAALARLDGLSIPSVPSTIALERETNPFLRAGDVEEFAARRRAKDEF